MVYFAQRSLAISDPGTRLFDMTPGTFLMDSSYVRKATAYQATKNISKSGLPER